MLNDLPLISLASGLARHAERRQELVAQNIANANTPGYRALDIAPFAEVAAQIADTPDADLRARPSETFGAAKPDGNTVSLEDQMMRTSSASRDHETALLVYSKAIEFLRTSLGRK